jgi:hypothetical protein
MMYPFAANLAGFFCSVSGQSGLLKTKDLLDAEFSN